MRKGEMEKGGRRTENGGRGGKGEGVKRVEKVEGRRGGKET